MKAGKDRAYGRKRWVTLCWTLMLSGTGVTQVQAQQRVSPLPPFQRDMAAPRPAHDAPSSPEWKQDARLGAAVALKAKSLSLASCLQALSPFHSVHLRVGTEIGQRRVTVFTEHLPLRSLMQALADTTDFAWRSEDRSNSDTGDLGTRMETTSVSSSRTYELYQTAESCKLQERRIAASEKREQWALTAQREALLAVAHNAQGEFAGLLSQLSVQQLNQACDLATQPAGLIAADNNRAYFSHMIGVKAFTDLRPEVQANVRHMLGRPESTGSEPNNPTLTPAVQDENDLNHSSIGIVAVDGGLRLGVVSSDGKDVWCSPGDVVRRQSIQGIDTDDDSIPEVTELMAGGKLIDLSQVPKATRQKRLRFPDNVKRDALPELLESLAQQTGLSVVADDFVRSRRTVYYWLLTDKPEYTLDEACEQIARAYGHRIIYKGNVLCIQTVSSGLDLRAEPPASLIAHLRELTSKHQPLGLEGYGLLGSLSRLQLDTLVTTRLPGITQFMELNSAQRAYPALHFYALLPPELRNQAFSSNGLRIRDLNGRQLEAFALLQGVGPLRSPTTEEAGLRPGLYLRHKHVNGRQGSAALLIVSDEEPARVTTYQLPM